MTEHAKGGGGERNPRLPAPLLKLGDEMIASLMETPEFWKAFQRVKLDSGDNPAWTNDRVVIIVAKGDHADKIAEAYDRG